MNRNIEDATLQMVRVINHDMPGDEFVVQKREKWERTMDKLKSQVGILLDAIPRGSRVCYIDYPVHDNIGDLLIMMGTEAFWKQNDISIVARYSVYDCPEVLDLPADTILAFHGGGNFGDLYSRHQNLRERLTKSNRQRRVVVLPQTVFYRAAANVSSLQASMGDHPDLHIFVRDEESLSRITKLLPNAHIRLSPDMAHYLWPGLYQGSLPSNRGPSLALIRRDIESTGVDIWYGNTKDWDDVYSGVDKQFIHYFQAVQRRRWLPAGLMAFVWLAYSGHIVRKAIRMYVSHHFIVTSRLHGHILACLMGITSEVFDNSYGKNSAYFRSWTHELPGCRLTDPNKMTP